MLGELNVPAAIPALIKATAHQDPTMRGAAAEALGRIGNPAAIPALRKALDDQDSAVRDAARAALGLLGELDSNLLKKRKSHP